MHRASVQQVLCKQPCEPYRQLQYNKERFFNRWRRGQGALKSNLPKKNQDFKSVMLMETPWVVDAQNETQAKQNLASLFEENTLNNNLSSALSELKSRAINERGLVVVSRQRAPPNDYMTLTIPTGFGRLKHLGVKTDSTLALKAIDYLDQWINKTYEQLRDKSLNNLSATIALYLYCRSFYLEERPIRNLLKRLLITISNRAKRIGCRSRVWVRDMLHLP